MALTFNLLQALNNEGTNGQAVFGAFSVGTYLTGGLNYSSYAIFDKYGYVGGSSHTPGDPFNTDLELGWMMSPGGGPTAYPHLGIENINGNTEIRPNLWNESIYFHPGVVELTDTWDSSGGRPAVIRFTAPYDAVLPSITGVFKKGTESFNVKSGWTILKNGVPISTRVVANQGDTIPISHTNVSVQQGDVLDFVVDSDVDGSTSDDSAITLNIELVLNKTAVPVISGTVLCSDTSVTGNISLHQSGTVELKTSSGTVVGTGTIFATPNTVNGNWEITGLNLENYQSQSLILVATDGNALPSDEASVLIEGDCVPEEITADAVDNEVGNKEINVSQVIDVKTNDITCSSGVRTYQITPNSQVNVTVNIFSVSGVVNYTPIAVGPFSFSYNLLCQGQIIDTATVSGTAFDPCIPVEGGRITGEGALEIFKESEYKVTRFTGNAPFTFTWSILNGEIVSGQSTDTVVIYPTDEPAIVSCVIRNCSASTISTVSKDIFVKKGCEVTVPVKFNCFVPINISGTIQGNPEPNRVISFSQDSITFRAVLGLRNYEFRVTNSEGIPHTIVLKNITC